MSPFHNTLNVIAYIVYEFLFTYLILTEYLFCLNHTGQKEGDAIVDLHLIAVYVIVVN